MFGHKKFESSKLNLVSNDPGSLENKMPIDFFVFFQNSETLCVTIIIYI